MSRILFIAKGTVADVTSGNVAPGLPAGTVQGDLLIACIAARDTPAFTNPAGGEWTTIATQQSSGNTSTTVSTSIASGHMAYCVRGASDPANTFTRTLGNFGRGMIFAFRGVTGTSPVDGAVATTLAANSVTAVTASGWTPSVEHTLVCIFCAAADNVTFSGWTQNGGAGFTAWTEQEDSGSNSGADGALGFAYAFTNSRTAITSVQTTVGASARHVVFGVGFKPAARPYDLALLGAGRN